MKTLKHTGDLIRMDLRRTFRTQPFYWLMLCAATMVMVVFMTGVTGDATLSGLLGAAEAGSFDPMMSMMGISIVPLFAMIAFVLNIGGDFSTGFAKNIFTFHSNKWEYILSKIVLGTVISTLYILFYMAGFLIVGKVMGLAWGTLSAGNAVLFILQKILLTIPLSSMVLFVMILLRNRGWGIVTAIVISMGAITMCMSMGAAALGDSFHWLAVAATWCVSGCSNMILTVASAGQVLQVIAVGAVWTLASALLTRYRLQKKDIL